jgi:nucleoside-diphosphate-sugar epimerase
VTIPELEQLLSEPSEEDRDSLSRLRDGLLILGAGGKMGPTLALLAKRAAPDLRVMAVSRFSDRQAADRLEAAGVEVIAADLMDDRDLRELPEAANIVFMAGHKFGTSGNPGATWARNVLLPAKCCERFLGARWVVFSSGNIYPLTRFGADEQTPAAPLGEYAQTVLGRERVFEYYGAEAVFIRLNYAVEPRYGTLLDIGRQVFEREEIDLTMGRFNCIWQRDASSAALRAFGLNGPLNVTGPETLSVRDVAERFGRIFGVQPKFRGQEGELALLSNAARCHGLLGYPKVTAQEAVECVARWIGMGGATLGKPTHFEVTDGRF